MGKTDGMDSGPSGAMGERGHSVAEVQLLTEDVVQSVAQPSMLGVVSKLGRNSDSEDSSYTLARVCWINTGESTEEVGDLRVIDRAFFDGDIVAKAKEPLGQTGRVVGVEIMVDLELPNGEIMRDVNSRRLCRVRSFAPGDCLIYDTLNGRVQKVHNNVTVLFDDGAKCKVSSADPGQLTPLNQTGLDNLDFPYFQGQKVQANSASVFEGAKWLKGSWNASRRMGTVVELEAGTVVVNWISSGKDFNGNSQSLSISYEEVDINKLICFPRQQWQIGYRCLPLTVMQPSSVVPMENSQVDEIPSDGAAESSLDNRNEYAVLIVGKRTTVDVLWQDGRISRGVDACLLLPVDYPGDYDFWPEQYVVERGAYGEGLDDGLKRIGVVKIVDAKQRTASVRWLKILNRTEVPLEFEFESEEVVSVYELMGHPDYSYRVGELVTRVAFWPSASEDTPEVGNSNLAGSYEVENTWKAEPEANDKEAKAEPPLHDFSWVGVIKGIQDGAIEVAWADGTVSKVGPQVIGALKSDLGYFSSSQASDLKDAEDIDDDDDDDDDDGSREMQGESDSEQQFTDAFRTMKTSPEGDALPDMGNKVRATKHFDGVSDASDHYYISETAQPTNSRKWAKKIQQEWSILEKNLPDAIYVRVYEDRMDLLRAVIVGAKETLYHDGLFVFDLYMPPEYPSVPPVLHYHSGGLRLNPNLYENGKVCLSLLNTWTGSGSERWHPSTSSILQVLVSIQGLILNEKPYFNEPGYDKQVGTGEGEKNSLLYNENSFLLLCKSMLYLLRRPQMHFEDLIRDHFQNRGQHFLLACRAYLAGAKVGSLTDSDLSGIDKRKFEDQSSAGFKLMLNKLVPKLAAAFEEVGAKSIEPVHEPSMVQAGQDF